VSHEATNWAFKQKGLKPATKVVLLALADCHNPHHGCFPSKKTLADDCEMSERAVYTHIKALEAAGLVASSSTFDRAKGQFASTRYMLGFEANFLRQELPSATSAYGELQELPSADIADYRRQILPNNTVIEPCKSSSSSADADGFDFLSAILSAVGLKNGRTPAHWMPPAATIHVTKWKRELGLTEAEIIEAAHESRKRFDTPPAGPKALDRVMQDLAAAKQSPTLTPTKSSGAKNDRSQSSRAINEFADRLSDGSVRIDYSNRNPFAVR
jgi:DNA-binding transcriptional ArsR family regulator